MAFRKATRDAVKIKAGILGASGSGKTKGALALASGLATAEQGRVAVIDSEKGRAAYYAGEVDFDHLVLADLTPEAYIAAIDEAVTAGYPVIVIDSLSHAWLTLNGEKEDYDRKNPRTNSWTNWRIFGARWDALMRHLLNVPAHVIATSRSKQAYEQVEQNGRKQIVKLGLKPEVRDGAEYELALVFEVSSTHVAEATKDNTGLFDRQQLDLCDGKVAAALIAWMRSGATPVAVPVPPKVAAPVATVDGGESVLRLLLLDPLVTEEESAKMQAWLAKEPRSAGAVKAACERIEGLIMGRRAENAAEPVSA